MDHVIGLQILEDKWKDYYIAFFPSQKQCWNTQRTRRATAPLTLTRRRWMVACSTTPWSKFAYLVAAPDEILRLGGLVDLRILSTTGRGGKPLKTEYVLYWNPLLPSFSISPFRPRLLYSHLIQVIFGGDFVRSAVIYISYDTTGEQPMPC